MSTRDRILEASRRLCREEGFRSLTMRRVAAAVGVSAPALYRHFDGKEALYAVLLEEARSSFEAFLERALSVEDPLPRFRASAQAYLDFALDKPDQYELVFLTRNQEGLLGVPSSVESWRERPPLNFQFCVDRVRECMASGVFGTGDPTNLALAFAGMAHGLVSLYLAGRFGDDRPRFSALYHGCIDQLIEGARSPALRGTQKSKPS